MRYVRVHICILEKCADLINQRSNTLHKMQKMHKRRIRESVVREASRASELERARAVLRVIRMHGTRFVNNVACGQIALSIEHRAAWQLGRDITHCKSGYGVCNIKGKRGINAHEQASEREEREKFFARSVDSKRASEKRPKEFFAPSMDSRAQS